MSEVYDKLVRAYDSIKGKIPFEPEVALVLGSGLGDFADSGAIKVETIIDYKDIVGFPVSTAPGHKGRFVFGTVGDVKVVCMQGRVHHYEGYSMQDVVMPTRLMKMMGTKVLFLTNASGGVKRGMKPGTLMMIRDHISCFIDSPLIGENIPELGVRFPDMSHVYDEDLQHIIRKSAAFLDMNIEEGVYLQLKGPNYETPAEIAMCRLMGADAVGMSTACEAQAANHMGMKICCISCITNLAAGISSAPLSEEEVIETGKRVSAEFTVLVSESIKNFKKENIF
ncbi:MAG: purine-nucleoside phosphorylase [Pseudobutyrivibrio sp.]|nr:purine-nucleoside phosphorylase [Pseudobutyrivibrio sp.]